MIHLAQASPVVPAGGATRLVHIPCHTAGDFRALAPRHVGVYTPATGTRCTLADSPPGFSEAGERRF